MDERNYAGVLPTEPPEELLPWLKKQGLLKMELLIYRMESYYDPLTEQKIRAVQLTCTACDRQVFTEKVDGGCHAAYAPAPFGFVHPETGEHLISGGHCLCPECGAEVNIKHVGSMSRYKATYEGCYPLTITRFEEKLVLIGWLFQKRFDKEGTREIVSWPYEAYVVERKKIVRLNSYQKTLGNISLSNQWQQRKRYCDKWGKAGLVYPWSAKLLEGSTAENSKLNVLMNAAKKKGGTCPISYLRLWLKYPNVENIIVQGASLILVEMMEHARGYYGGGAAIPVLEGIDWKQKSPFKMLGMNKDEFRTCVKNKWDLAALRFWQGEKERGRALSAEDMELAQGIGFYNCDRLRKDKSMDYLKVARYIQKQARKDRRSDMNILWDYWRVAEDTGEDLTLPSVLFPPRLMSAHDRVEQVRKWREEARKAAEREARKKQFEKRFAELNALAWEHDGILIRPAASEDELRKEGKDLDHCVGSYAAQYAKGEKAIFFIRRVNKPDKSWYTLELDVKSLTVRQNRGLRNCAKTKEIQAFEDAWITWCREQATPKKKRKARQRINVPVAIAG